MDPHERNEILDSLKSLQEKVKKYNDAELNPVKVNIMDPEKENYKPPSTVDEITFKVRYIKIRLLSCSAHFSG